MRLTSCLQSAAAATEDWATEDGTVSSWDDGLTIQDDSRPVQYDVGTSGQPSMDQRARMEDLPDDDWRGQLWQEEFPSHLNTGASVKTMSNSRHLSGQKTG